MKQGMKFDNYIEEKVAASKQRLLKHRSVLQQENKCLYVNGYHYYQITLASLPVTHSFISGNLAFELTITFSAFNVISFSFKKTNARFLSFSNLVLLVAAGQQLKLKCLVPSQEYICEQSIKELKDMGYIVNDGFVLRIQ